MLEHQAKLSILIPKHLNKFFSKKKKKLKNTKPQNQ